MPLFGDFNMVFFTMDLLLLDTMGWKRRARAVNMFIFQGSPKAWLKKNLSTQLPFFLMANTFFFFFTNYPQLYQILHFLFLTLHLCASCMEYWVLKWEILWVGWVQLWLSIKKKKYENSKLNNSSFYSSYPLPVNSLKPLYWCLPTIAKENALFKCSEFWYNSICKKSHIFLSLSFLSGEINLPIYKFNAPTADFAYNI